MHVVVDESGAHSAALAGEEALRDRRICGDEIERVKRPGHDLFVDRYARLP
jgi:hypothetical protein